MRRVLLFALMLVACGGSSAPPASSACSSDGGFCADGGLICCEGSCTDISSDPSNCGGCGYSCSSGATCFGGTCG